MASFTQELYNAVRVKVPYLVCSTGVWSYQTLKFVFCIICKLCSHTGPCSVLGAGHCPRTGMRRGGGGLVPSSDFTMYKVGRYARSGLPFLLGCTWGSPL